QVEVVEARVPGLLHRRFGLGAVVDPPQPLQAAVVEALDAEAEPVDAGCQVVGKPAVFGSAGVGFQGDLEPGHEAQAGGGALEEAVNRCGGEQAGGAAAKEDGVDGTAPGQGQVVVEVGEEGVDVGVKGEFAAGLVRVEVAVGAFSYAPGEVDVEGERRGGQHLIIVVGVVGARPLKLNLRGAGRRWLLASVSPGSRCARASAVTCGP